MPSVSGRVVPVFRWYRTQIQQRTVLWADVPSKDAVEPKTPFAKVLVTRPDVTPVRLSMA